MKEIYSVSEIRQTLTVLGGIFDLARVVDPVRCQEYVFFEENEAHQTKSYSCYSVWNKRERCKNCVSMSALLERTRKTKFEFIENDVYHVTARYVRLNDTDLVLEMVNKINDEVLLGAYGTSEFIDRITKFNDILYTDPLTGVYNRKYLNSRPRSMDCVGSSAECSLAMADIDNFKHINDTFGHTAGDEVLKSFASLLRSQISDRRGDCVVRYGGDEFLLIISRIPYEKFENRMQRVVDKAREMIFPQYPGLKVSLSIGGVSQRENPDAAIPDLIGAADKRLYTAKHMGGNCVVVRD